MATCKCQRAVDCLHARRFADRYSNVNSILVETINSQRNAPKGGSSLNAPKGGSSLLQQSITI